MKKLCADRGMFSRSNEALLQSLGIQSGLCPRNPVELQERLAEPGQREGLKRRGVTEARVAIFKNVILGNPARGKSMEAREKACGWAVLSHNLWVVARMPESEEKGRGVNKEKPPSVGGQQMRRRAA